LQTKNTCNYTSQYSSYFHATEPPNTSTLSLHDALPICKLVAARSSDSDKSLGVSDGRTLSISDFNSDLLDVNPLRTCSIPPPSRSEEHTSELQSQSNLVCRLLLEKKKRYRSRARVYRIP